MAIWAPTLGDLFMLGVEGDLDLHKSQSLVAAHREQEATGSREHWPGLLLPPWGVGPCRVLAALGVA